MKIQVEGDTVWISEVPGLGADNANPFRDRARAAMSQAQKNIVIDLAQTAFIDSCGLGALVALHKTVCGRKGIVRLLNPQAPVRQILELTRMHRIFEIAET